ncbi:unnamed protein product [Symbiodinium sp. CCMP2456]|nr:unnamed protein product [Symbiodinium sp. CCMP2456]
MHLVFVILFLPAAQASPLRIPGQWNCRGALEWPTMQQLKRQIGMLLRSTILPSRILGVSMSGSYLLLLNQNECPAARWTMELLLAELGMARQQADRFGRDDDLPFLTFFGGGDGASLFHELFWGAGPAWSSVSLGGWSTFALIGRLSQAFQVHLMAGRGQQELLSLQNTTRRRAVVAQLPELLALALARLQATNVSGSWAVRAVAAAAVEESLRGWSKRALSNGLPPGQVAASLLVDAQSPDLWNALDKVLLPDFVQICLPATLGLESSEVFRQCLARHCTKHWGPDEAGAAARANRSSATGLTMFHIGSDRDVMSDSIRSGCFARCSNSVIDLLNRVSEVLVDLPATTFTYVDAGAAMGECMLSAAFLLPDGRLRGLAFEALPKWAKRMRQSLRLNGVSFSGNGTQVEVKTLALGQSGRKLLGSVDGGGFYAKVTHKGGGIFMVKTSSLDDEITANMQFRNEAYRIDFLHIFANHCEPDILKGARQLLLERRVGCVLAQAHDLGSLNTEIGGVLRRSGYAVMNQTSYVAGSPADAVSLSGGEVCDQRFFRWWLHGKHDNEVAARESLENDGNSTDSANPSRLLLPADLVLFCFFRL